MAREHLSKEQYDFLVLTTESGSPHHPFVRGLRRMLGLHEIVEDKTRGTVALQVVPATEDDVNIVKHHHEHEDEQGPIYAPRIVALEVLLNGPAKKAESAQAKEAPKK